MWSQHFPSLPPTDSKVVDHVKVLQTFLSVTSFAATQPRKTSQKVLLSWTALHRSVQRCCFTKSSQFHILIGDSVHLLQRAIISCYFDVAVRLRSRFKILCIGIINGMKGMKGRQPNFKQHKQYFLPLCRQISFQVCASPPILRKGPRKR